MVKGSKATYSNRSAPTLYNCGLLHLSIYLARPLMKKHWIIFLIFCFIFLLYKVFEQTDYQISFLSNYLEDIIAIPIILKSSLLIINNIHSKFHSFQISRIDIVIFVLVFSMYFEFYLPKVDSRFTADLMDVVCYTLGGIIFARFMNQPMVINLTRFVKFLKRPGKS
jgi:hypothetical protein